MGKGIGGVGILALGAVAVVGFIALDHFVLKDKFGIWLKLAKMMGRPQVTYTPRGGRLDISGKDPEQIAGIQNRIEEAAQANQKRFEEATARAQAKKG